MAAFVLVVLGIPCLVVLALWALSRISPADPTHALIRGGETTHVDGRAAFSFGILSLAISGVASWWASRRVTAHASQSPTVAMAATTAMAPTAAPFGPRLGRGSVAPPNAGQAIPLSLTPKPSRTDANQGRGTATPSTTTSSTGTNDR
jgi:hypothetical protein